LADFNLDISVLIEEENNGRGVRQPQVAITLHYIIKLFIVAKVEKTARSTMAQVTQQCITNATFSRYFKALAGCATAVAWE